MTIKVEFLPGTNIKHALKEAQRLSDQLGCSVQFKFNNITCIATIHGSAEKGLEEYEAMQKSWINPSKNDNWAKWTIYT